MKASAVEPKKTKESSERSRLLRSSELFLGSREIVIEHNNKFYRLIITKAGKLILNK